MLTYKANRDIYYSFSPYLTQIKSSPPRALYCYNDYISEIKRSSNYSK